MLIYLLFLFYSYGAWPGDGVRGGGDVVTCHSSKENTFKGLYPLGFIQMQMVKNSEHPKLLKGTYSCTKVLRLLKNKLKKEIPVLGAGFENYLDSFLARNKKDSIFTKKHFQRRWTSCESQLCLNNYKDEGHLGHLILKLPANCKKTSQFAFRTEKVRNNITYINYYLNESVLKKMSGPVCAFNLVHEWLRDFLQNADELYPSSLSIFSDNLREKIDSKQGLYEYLPSSLLIKKRPLMPLELYFKSRHRNIQTCSGKKGQIVCSFKYIQNGNRFGIVTKMEGDLWTVIIPHKKKPFEKIKAKKSNFKKMDLDAVPSGFIEFLLTLPSTKLMEIRSGS